MIAKFIVMVGALFAPAGVSLNVIANLLDGRGFAFNAQCWSIAISIFVVGFGLTVGSIGFYSVRERTRRQRRD